MSEAEKPACLVDQLPDRKRRKPGTELEHYCMFSNYRSRLALLAIMLATVAPASANTNLCGTIANVGDNLPVAKSDNATSVKDIASVDLDGIRVGILYQTNDGSRWLQPATGIDAKQAIEFTRLFGATTPQNNGGQFYSIANPIHLRGFSKHQVMIKACT